MLGACSSFVRREEQTRRLQLQPHHLGDGVALDVVGAAANRADAHVAEEALDVVRATLAAM